MKTLHLLLLLLATTALKTLAHNYQTIYSNQSVLFKESLGYRIKGLRVDSVKIVAADTVLYPFANIQEVSKYCYSPYKASWNRKKPCSTIARGRLSSSIPSFYKYFAPLEPLPINRFAW